MRASALMVQFAEQTARPERSDGTHARGGEPKFFSFFQ
jgi:hypothetical protein